MLTSTSPVVLGAHVGGGVGVRVGNLVGARVGAVGVRVGDLVGGGVGPKVAHTLVIMAPAPNPTPRRRPSEVPMVRLHEFSVGAKVA